MTLHSAIPEAICNGASDSELDNVIQQYLDDQGIDKTISQWRIANYAQLRRWTYPPMEEYNDAQVKLNSEDKDLEEEGQKQLNNYYKKCLDVKNKFPKKK